MLDWRLYGPETSAHRRTRTALLLLALLALLTLSVRPIADRALAVKPDPARLTIVALPDGTHVCYVATDCQTTLAATTGFDTPARLPSVSVPAAIAVAPFVEHPRALVSHTASLDTPPPRSSLV